MKSTIEKQFIYKGYDAFVIAYDRGHRCGYVEIPKESMFFGKHYSEKLPIGTEVIEGEKIGKRGIISVLCYDGKTIDMSILFDVHGGITYSNDSLLENKDSWFIGFDCAHAGDAKDFSIMSDEQKDFNNKYKTNLDGDVVRTAEYVEQECKNLIDQIIKYDGLYNPKKYENLEIQS